MANAQILSIELCAGIVEWLKILDERGYIPNGMFKGYYAYPNLKPEDLNTDAICVYHGRISGKENSFYEIGSVILAFVFKVTGNQRELKYKKIITAIETIRALQQVAPGNEEDLYMQRYLSNNFVPGLQIINARDISRTLGSNLVAALKSDSKFITIELETDYKIRIDQNYQAATDLNKDYWSPNVDVYHPITPEVEIETVPYKEEINQNA